MKIEVHDINTKDKEKLRKEFFDNCNRLKHGRAVSRNSEYPGCEWCANNWPTNSYFSLLFPYENRRKFSNLIKELVETRIEGLDIRLSYDAGYRYNTVKVSIKENE